MRTLCARKRKRFVLTVMKEPVVDQNDRGHSFYDRDRSGEYARIVPTAASEEGIVAMYVHSLLFPNNSGSWLEGHPEIELFTIADAPLNTPGAIRQRPDSIVSCDKGVVVFRSLEECAGEAAAYFETLGCGQ